MIDLSAILNNAQGAKAANSRDRLAQDKDTFLRLLTTQLQNQDPLNPMDSTEFTNQLVAFSGVEQQIQANQTLANLQTMSILNLSTMGLGYIGLNVDIAGNNLTFDGQTPISMSYNLLEPAANARLSIVDDTGATVFSTPAEISQGKHEFTWDGRDGSGQLLPQGNYKVQISAINDAGKTIGTSTIVPGWVEGIETGDDGNVLLLVGNNKIPITDVRKARVPGA